MRILTFDLEDWFHLLDHSSTKGEDQWNKYPSRFVPAVDLILHLLDHHSIKATFFCLGWIGKKYPEVIRKIVSLGHEIGSHSDLHQLVFEQSPSEFGKDLDSAVKSLEDSIGKKVTSFRAPGFSITEKTPWAFEYLISAGIETDSSIFPAKRAHGGFKKFPANTPCLVTMNGMSIREFPISTKKIMGQPLVFSGGGYFRIFPYRWIKNWTHQSEYIMTYFHPRDFDPDQPMLRDLSAYRKFKSYYGLKYSYSKLNKWLQDFAFTDLSGAIKTINWNTVPRINLDT